MSDTIHTSPLADLFRAAFFNKISHDAHRGALCEILELSNAKELVNISGCLAEVLSGAYRILEDKYRCEYVYKNAVLNNLYLSRHNVRKSAYVPEFYCGRSRADIAIFNGTSTAYEIKTELDSYSKLEKQISDYKRVFDKIYVVTPDGAEEIAKKYCAPEVGLLVFGRRGRISKIRAASSGSSTISPDCVFDCLRKDEYVQVCEVIAGSRLDLPNSMVYTECKKIFCKLKPNEAHAYFVECMKRRRRSELKLLSVSIVPPAVRHAWLHYNGTMAGHRNILKNLFSSFRL